ncbi:ATP-dependent acyl-CoA ligase [Actinomadura sp. KC345]|uniref:AMP-binding protein n=1 Tax=Actinomadura sp. KC345 TaxID=2530371 RepID=UPI001046B1F8|nr:AMP-binding protein [Actinomadura sp. KC345]TDC58557.1 ATP-dependent acyl-CoA ligase [Actinomadura sp. KC345]
MQVLSGRDRTIPTFLRTKAERNGSLPALRFQDETISYGELYADALRLASGLVEIGVRPGDTVAIALHNSLDFHRCWFAVNLAGAVEVPVNTEYRRDGLAYVLNNCEARVLIADSDLLARVLEIREDLTDLRVVLARGELPDDPRGLAVRPLRSLPVAARTLPVVGPGDHAAVMYTSGTTGPPKGVVLPHGCAISWAEETVKMLGLRPGETHYCSYPLFHTLAQYFATMPALANDGVLALAERFSVTRFWDDVRRFGAASANMMGSTVSLLHAVPAGDDDRDNPLRIAFGAPAPPAILPAFQERFGLRFVEIYGSSEANVVLWNSLDDVRGGTCGKPIGAFDVRLVDADDEEVPDGEVGEIVTRPHRPHSMMSGYYNMPAATAAAFRNLWFHTGDLARRDADGYYTFVDRAKDAIRRRGENISSWEVESVVARWPQVEDCAAFGVPSALSEEDVMVVIVPKRGQEPRLDELTAFCAEHMPRYMVPRYWEIADGLPRTQTGKVEKFRLRDRGVGPKTWDRERIG